MKWSQWRDLRLLVARDRIGEPKYHFWRDMILRFAHHFGLLDCANDTMTMIHCRNVSGLQTTRNPGCSVMAGLVPAIHAVPLWHGLRTRQRGRGVDGQDKPGHDESGGTKLKGADGRCVLATAKR